VYVQVIDLTMNHADVSGLADHAVTDLPIVTAAGVLTSSQGPIIGIFHLYAHLGSGNTIHSTNQMRKFGVDVCDIPRTLNGKQRIHHPDGYIIPLSIRNGLHTWKCTLPPTVTFRPTPMFSSRRTLLGTQVSLILNTLSTKWILWKMTILHPLGNLMSITMVNSILDNAPIT
jgi:hypothetical protein